MNIKIGAKGTALSSDYFKVISERDGARATLILEKGIKKDFILEKDVTENHGTYVEFIPSQEVYNLEPVNIDFEEIKKMCRDWSYLCKGITFRLFNHVADEQVVYLSKNGLLDLMEECGGNALNKTPLHIEVEENGVKAELVMEWTDSRYEDWHVFTNGLENVEGGTSLTGIKTALTNFFKKKVKGEANPDILRKGLFYAVSCKVPNPSFANQTKTKVNNPELRGLCQRATNQMLEDFQKKHNDEFEKILDLLTKELKAERAAEKARQQVLEATKDIEKNQKRKVFASDKLKDAEFLGQDSTLLIVEGNSAAASMAIARDITKYGILAIRGKMLNCLAHNDEKIFQNEEIKLLLSAMNITPGKYNREKLRYGKIAICVDADSDGYHIGLLIMSALRYLAPEFLEEGRLYWLRSPLYIIKTSKKEYYYFSDEEFNKAKIKGEVTRAKGLGALSEAQARASMFSEEFQRMDKLEMAEGSAELLESLMGEDIQPRKDFVFSKIDFSQIKE